jgi:outer membrane receptor protein involved in Fe transport
VNDNLTWVRQTHTFKTGIFYQRSRKDQIAWGNINGQFSFGDEGTSGGICPGTTSCQLGDPLASALLGDFTSFDQSTARPTGYFRYNQLEFYVQDTWKATRQLTLDYGMRFAWIPPQYDAKNQVALFNPAANECQHAEYGSGRISRRSTWCLGLLLRIPDPDETVACSPSLFY